MEEMKVFEDNEIFKEDEVLELVTNVEGLTADSVGEFSFSRGEE